MWKIMILLLGCSVMLPLWAIELTQDSNCDVDANKTSFDKTNRTWQGICDGVVISGDYICSDVAADAGVVSVEAPTIDVSENRGFINHNCWCKMTGPYVGAYWVATGYSTYRETPWDEDSCQGLMDTTVHSSCHWRCARLWNESTSGFNNYYHYEGYYTDEDLLKVKSGLFAATAAQAVCEIGISKLRLSTGDSFQLYAEKYTEPSLVVRYNNQLCYGNLEQGGGKLNIKYNGVLYHVTE